MPTFSTPTPIDLAVDLPVGALDVVAGDATESVVTVSPTNPDKAVDQRAAAETAVDLDGQRLSVRGPRGRATWLGPSGSVDVSVTVPSGSRLSGEVAYGSVRTTGRLAATRVKASSGSATLEAVGDLWLRAGHGSVVVETVDGSAEITADHGQIRLGRVRDDALLKASHGSVCVREAGGDLDARLSYGDLEVTRAHGSVAAKTAYGTVRLGEVSTGAVDAQSGYGEISVAVRTGVVAWLDLASTTGRVRNELDDDQAPTGDEPSVAVRARTQFGDVLVTRAAVRTDAL